LRSDLSAAGRAQRYRSGVASSALSPTVGPPAEGVHAVEVDGRVSLYVPATDQIVSLNETASTVWSLCDGHRDTDEVVGTVAAVYGRGIEDIRAEVCQVLEDLRAAGALAPLPRATSGVPAG
jgi:hypothetical protein